MLNLIYLLIVLTIVVRSNIVNCESLDDRLKVILPHGGILIGNYMKTVNERPIRAFRGIPYAEPPIGELRFQAPIPAKPWSGEKIVEKDSSICPQQNAYERVFETFGNEDCLYLNVYVPYVNSDNKPLSVMVYFHGGGWMTGSGESKYFGPQRILDHDVILVSGNYRLGALGFLSTGTKDCPGNYGMKDQVMMLKWIQENIASFGGNPSDVTIFGESAGGASVGYHMYSHLSKGLFHKGILQSGTNFNEWAFGNEQFSIDITKKIAEQLGCLPERGENWKAIIECIRTKSAYEIASIVKPLFKYDIDPSVIFRVVVEPHHDGAFLTEAPQDNNIPPNGNIPIMIGFTHEDGAIKSGPVLHLLKDDFTSKFYDILPIVLLYDHLPKQYQEEITRAIDQFYFKKKHDWSKENHFNLTNLYTDLYFTWGQDKFLRNRFAAAENTSPTYVYVFNHRGPESLSEGFHAGPEYYGVCHTDELPYLFLYKLPNLGGDKNEIGYAAHVDQFR